MNRCFTILSTVISLLVVVEVSGGVRAEGGPDYCTEDEGICFVDETEILKLPDLSGQRAPYRGQTWSISWGDANGNIWPDLYLNHHWYQGPERHYPQSHLIFDIGDDPTGFDYEELPAIDQHSAVFVDLNDDGQDDIIEVIGGASGEADLTDYSTGNVVFLSSRADPHALNPAIGMNLAMAGARGRSVLPINHQGALKLLFLNAPRSDGLRDTALFKRNETGAFEEDEIFTTGECVEADCSAEKTDIGQCRDALQAHLNSDDFVDLLCLNDGSSNGMRLFLGSPNGTSFVNVSQQASFGFFRDGSVVDVDNDGSFEIILILKNELRLLTLNVGNQGKYRIVSKSIGDPNLGKPIGLVSGDWDNDSDVDLISYHRTKDALFHFVVWENDGLGNFQFQRHDDVENPGNARNVAVADYNLDGALDVLFSDGKGPPEETTDGGYVLLKGVRRNNWLEIDLRDTLGLDGLGSRVTVSFDDVRMTRGQYGGVHGEVQDFTRLHFGAGAAEKAKVVVKWADGDETVLDDVETNQVITIRE